MSAREAIRISRIRVCTFLRLDFSPQFLQTLAAQTDGLNPDRVELNNQYRFHDPKITQMAQWLADEVQNGAPGGKLYMPSVMWRYRWALPIRAISTATSNTSTA